ncbi:Rrf2 family transcriptional regulator [Sulfuricella sp. T08]|uniref:RrF2 family transcriptional regulator n=1 Tax=Sulfuricella sp. T08 TaxID=1632857 RepID=UPI000617964E|nr:Rrf2 family transcriptional regulator [Sulfuricella sp. T08]GAO35208.1 Rrf2 family transcriptional regulator [Sulfuricella sp. T08]
MILSRTSQYAIRALIYFSSLPCGERITNNKVAEYLDVPVAYLAKIMQKLCKGNLIYSHPGRHGGFCLREGGEKTNLIQIVSLIEGGGFADKWLLDLENRSNEITCVEHSIWKPIREDVFSLLNELTLEHLALAE